MSSHAMPCLPEGATPPGPLADRRHSHDGDVVVVAEMGPGAASNLLRNPGGAARVSLDGRLSADAPGGAVVPWPASAPAKVFRFHPPDTIDWHKRDRSDPRVLAWIAAARFTSKNGTGARR